MQKIVHKILRSLPKRFHAKVTSIEDSKDLGNMKLESSSMKLKPRIKDKGVALKTKAKSEVDMTKENLPYKTLAMINENFQQFMKENFE